MTALRQFLRADSLAHAEVLDQFICQHLRERDGSKGSQWSGVYERNGTFAVLFASPASELFGEEIADRIETEVIDENGDTDWPEVEPAPPEEEPTP